MDKKVSDFISWQLERIAADLRVFRAAYKAAKCAHNRAEMLFYGQRIRDWKTMASIMVG